MEASNVARICSVLLRATTVSRERLRPGNGLVLCWNPPQRASGREWVLMHSPRWASLRNRHGIPPPATVGRRYAMPGGRVRVDMGVIPPRAVETPPHPPASSSGFYAAA